MGQSDRRSGASRGSQALPSCDHRRAGIGVPTDFDLRSAQPYQLRKGQTHHRWQNPCCLNGERPVPDDLEERFDGSSVHGETDDCRTISRKDVIEALLKTESSLIVRLAEFGIPELVVLREIRVKCPAG